MNLIKLIKLLPDQRIVTFHRVDELLFDMNTPATVQVIIGSWEVLENALVNSRPDSKYLITLPNNSETINNILQTILSLPEWSSGEIINTDQVITVTENTLPYIIPELL